VNPALGAAGAWVGIEPGDPAPRAEVNPALGAAGAWVGSNPATPRLAPK